MFENKNKGNYSTNNFSLFYLDNQIFVNISEFSGNIFTYFKNFDKKANNKIDKKYFVHNNIRKIQKRLRETYRFYFQIVPSSIIISINQIVNAVHNVFKAFNTNSAISKNFEIELLLYLTHQRQISVALEKCDISNSLDKDNIELVQIMFGVLNDNTDFKFESMINDLENFVFLENLKSFSNRTEYQLLNYIQNFDEDYSNLSIFDLTIRNLVRSLFSWSDLNLIDIDSNEQNKIKQYSIDNGVLNRSSSLILTDNMISIEIRIEIINILEQILMNQLYLNNFKIKQAIKYASFI